MFVLTRYKSEHIVYSSTARSGGESS